MALCRNAGVINGGFSVLLCRDIDGTTCIGKSLLTLYFAVLGIVNGYQMLSYIFSQSVASNRWLIEHLSSMCGSGIAVYTAFFAFGARHALAHIGQWQLLFWVMPGVLGGVAIYFYSKKYETLNTRK